jgi:hypothetical protein
MCALCRSKEDNVETGLQSIDWERFGPLRPKVHRGQIRNREGLVTAGAAPACTTTQCTFATLTTHA